MLLVERSTLPGCSHIYICAHLCSPTRRQLTATSEELVAALVAQIFEGIRDHVVQSMELKVCGPCRLKHTGSLDTLHTERVTLWDSMLVGTGACDRLTTAQRFMSSCA